MVKWMTTCWICNKVIGQTNQPTADCGAMDQKHIDARNPPQKDDDKKKK